MKLEEIRKVCEEIVRKYDISHSEYREERREGRIFLVNLTVKFKAELPEDHDNLQRKVPD